MKLNQRATELYSVDDKRFKEELLHLLSKMAEEILDLKDDVRSLENWTDDHTMFEYKEHNG